MKLLEDHLMEAFLTPIRAEADHLGMEVFIAETWDPYGKVLGFHLRSIEIHVLDGATYLMEFHEGKKSEGAMRTGDALEAVAAGIHWLQGCYMDEMYDRHSAIDEGKRKLQKLDVELVRYCPSLTTAARSVTGQEIFGRYSISSDDRHCSVTYYVPESEGVGFDFSWDGCCIATCKTHNQARLASAIHKWLIERVPPSALSQEFDFIQPNMLAQYYEEGRGIEGEFIQSWNEIEDFYTRFFSEVQTDYLTLVQEMRQHGFDKTLRAGQSMIRLILSRARRYGLRPDDPCLMFVLLKGKMEITDHQKNVTILDTVAYNDQVDHMLKELEMRAIT